MPTLKTVSVSEFTTYCKQYLEKTHTSQATLIITEQGKPIAKLIPMEESYHSFAYGDMKNTVTILEDILEPTLNEWDILSDEKGETSN